MLEMDVPVGAGTDATRVASYDPWVSLYWLTTGKTLGGMPPYGEENVLDRETALRLWTQGSAWFSGAREVKGTMEIGKAECRERVGQDGWLRVVSVTIKKKTK